MFAQFNKPTIRKNIFRARQRGTSLFFLIAGLVVTFVSVICIVDARLMRLTHLELETASKAASLAACRTYFETHDVHLAREIAKQVASQNLVNHEPMILADTDVRFGRSQAGANATLFFNELFEPVNTVQVSARRTQYSKSGAVPLLLGRVFGVSTFEPVHVSSAIGRVREICLVVDRRRSNVSFNPCLDMVPHHEAQSVLDQAIDSLFETLQKTLPSEQISIVSFRRDHSGGQSTAEVLQPLTLDYASARHAARKLAAAHTVAKRSIVDAIDIGAAALTDNRHVRQMPQRVMLVCGIGNYVNSELLRHTTSGIIADGILVHAVTIGSLPDESLIETARSTGGQYFLATTAEEAQAAFRQIGNLLPKFETR